MAEFQESNEITNILLVHVWGRSSNRC